MARGKKPSEPQEDQAEAAMRELARLHGEYTKKMRELERRQKELMKRFLKRIDDEKVRDIQSELKGGA